MAEITDMRQEIDKLDKELLNVLTKRFEFCKKIGIVKVKNGQALKVPEREEEVLNHCTQVAKELGLESNFVRKLFSLIMAQSVALEEKQKNL